MAVFSVSAAEGEFRPKIVLRAVFPTEQACNELGRELAKAYSYEDPSKKSFSICIPESAFDEKGLKVLNVEP